jgi:hypothetical protein
MEFTPSHRSQRVVAGSVLVAAVALGLAAPAGASAPKHATTTIEKSTKLPKKIPNLVNFLAHGSKTYCYTGGVNNNAARRPCAALLRTGPELSDDIINANPNSTVRVGWPLEAYKSEAGDPLVIECYDPNGQSDTTDKGDHTSTDWYAVVVPESRIKNPVVQAEVNQDSPNIQLVTYGGQTVLVGWVSVEDFNQNVPSSNVPVCAS